MMMPPWCNRWLLAAIMLSMSLHFMILEVDFLAVRSRSTSTRVPCQSCFIVFPAKSSIKGEFLKSEMRFVNNLSFNKSAFQLPTYTDKLPLPAFARRTLLLQQSIDISCAPGPQQQTCSSGFAADRRTDTVPFRRLCSTYYAGMCQ